MSSSDNNVYTLSSGLLKTYVRLHFPQYCRSKCDAMNTPAPQSSLGHSRRRRVILPFSSTLQHCHIMEMSAVLPSMVNLRQVTILQYPIINRTRGQNNLTKSASRVRGHPRGSRFVPLNSWGRVSY